MKLILNLTMSLLLIGLVSSCKKDTAEKAAVGAAKEVAKTMAGKSYAVDASSSKVMWTGTKPTGAHSGTIDVSSGSAQVSDGKLTGGNFTLDMNTISCTDLEGDSKLSLEAHLKGTRDESETDDFFNVAKYPTATFELTKTTALNDGSDATHLVYGNLTMKGVTKEVGFKATVDIQDSGISVKTPEFTINRTDWGIKFMSKNFIEGLKDKFIEDDIKLSLELKAS